MTDRELLQMALSALEEYCEHGVLLCPIERREALQARLAQPEPEPFEYWNVVEGWVKIDEVRQHFDTANCGTIYKHEGEGRIPLYAAPPKKEWVGLTEREAGAIMEELDAHGTRLYEFANAIEAKLKEKNAPNL